MDSRSRHINFIPSRDVGGIKWGGDKIPGAYPAPRPSPISAVDSYRRPLTPTRDPSTTRLREIRRRLAYERSVDDSLTTSHPRRRRDRSVDDSYRRPLTPAPLARYPSTPRRRLLVDDLSVPNPVGPPHWTRNAHRPSARSSELACWPPADSCLQNPLFATHASPDARCHTPAAPHSLGTVARAAGPAGGKTPRETIAARTAVCSGIYRRPWGRGFDQHSWSLLHATTQLVPKNG